MMAYLVERLDELDKQIEAKGIVQRHKLHKHVKPEIMEKLKKVNYDHKKDSTFNSHDAFEPLSRPLVDYCILPKDIKVEWIDSDDQVPKLNELKQEQCFIGVDAEWRPQLSQYHKTKPSLL